MLGPYMAKTDIMMKNSGAYPMIVRQLALKISGNSYSPYLQTPCCKNYS